MHAVGDAREHSAASGKNDVTEKITADVEVAFEDRVVAESGSHQRLRQGVEGGYYLRCLVNTSAFKTDESRLEQSLCRAEPSPSRKSLKR